MPSDLPDPTHDPAARDAGPPPGRGEVDAHVRAGRIPEAVALLEDHGGYEDAGWLLLRLLPRDPTPVEQLEMEQRAAAERAATHFARAGARTLACGLLINLGEMDVAAEILRRSGRSTDAARVGRGGMLAASPWPQGELFALNPVTGRRFHNVDDLLSTEIPTTPRDPSIISNASLPPIMPWLEEVSMAEEELR